MKAVLIDNYDSFTYNLRAQLLAQGIEVDVFRNDQVSLEELEKYELFFFSPGPSLPENAGNLLKIIDHFKYQKPMLGICLGMQAIGQVFGAELKLLRKPLHGLQMTVRHFDNQIFTGLQNEFSAARYHSWVIDKTSIPAELNIIAVAEDDQVMAIKHVDLPIYGFQFHPESVLTDEGDQLIQNFIEHIKIIQSEKVT